MEDNNLISRRILNSAENLFFRYGFSKSTADEIAQEAGISKRTLYKYFGSKVIILEKLINYKLNYIHEQMQLILNSDYDFPEKLKQVMGIVADTLTYVSRDFLEDIRKSVPEVWMKIFDYRKELVEKYYTRILIEGKNAGHFKKDLNTGVAVLLMISAMDLIINPPPKGYLPPDLEKQVPLDSSVLFDEMLSLIYDGILTNNTSTI
ncbi:MAG: TetR/AcrR family transcriptional regulator [Bacteroidota bacterium]